MSTNNSNNSSSGNGTIFVGGTAASSGNFTITISQGWFSVGPWPTSIAESAKEQKKDNRDGCSCKKCKEFYPYSEPNQEDGTLICYACRHGY